MEAIMAWIIANPGTSAAIGAAVLDTIFGAVDNKKIKYKGIVLRVLAAIGDKARQAKDYEKGSATVLTMAILSVAMLLSACTMYHWPECNEHYAQDAQLVQVANKHKMCLKDLRRNILSVNMLAVSIDPAFAKHTRLAIENTIIPLLDTSITDIAFKQAVSDNLRAAILRDLIELNAPLLADFNTGKVIDEESKLLIKNFCIEDVIPRLKIYENMAAKQ